MQTKEEAAREYENKELHIEDGQYTSMAIIEAFTAGVEFAQRWISVDDELPEDTQEILMKNEDWENECYPEGVRSGWYNPTHCNYFTSLWDDNKEEFVTSESTPTHWRPIELK